MHLSFDLLLAAFYFGSISISHAFPSSSSRTTLAFTRPTASRITKPLLAAVPTSGSTTTRYQFFCNQNCNNDAAFSPSRKFKMTLFASSTEDNISDKKDDSNKTTKKINGRKKRVGYGYKLSMVIYAVLGLSTLVPAFLSPEMIAISLNYAGGPVLGAGLAYILSGAAANDRLSSDTYKRLNLMYATYGFLWLLAGVLVRQTVPMTRGAKILSNPLVMIASFYAMINGLKGWGYGVKGWDKSADTSFVTDLVGLIKSSAKVLFSSPFQNNNVKATLYYGTTIFAGVLKVMKLVDLYSLCTQIGTTTVTAAQFGSWSIGYAKITLLATTAFTLLDAAKRDRLEGSTFIELNILSSFTWFGMGGAYYYYLMSFNYGIRFFFLTSPPFVCIILLFPTTCYS